MAGWFLYVCARRLTSGRRVHSTRPPSCFFSRQPNNEMGLLDTNVYMVGDNSGVARCNLAANGFVSREKGRARAACKRDICSRSENSANLWVRGESARARNLFSSCSACWADYFSAPRRPWHLESAFQECVANHADRKSFFYPRTHWFIGQSYWLCAWRQKSCLEV